MGSQCFATNELVGDQGSAAPPASRKSLSQALDEAVSCSEKRRLWLELQPRGPGSMDSVPRRGSSAATCTSTTTLDRPLLSPAISQPEHPRAPRSPPSAWQLFPLNSHRTRFARHKRFLFLSDLISPSGGLLTRCCLGVSIPVGEDLAGPPALLSNDNCELRKMLDYQSVKSVKLILTERTINYRNLCNVGNVLQLHMQTSIIFIPQCDVEGAKRGLHLTANTGTQRNYALIYIYIKSVAVIQ